MYVNSSQHETSNQDSVQSFHPVQPSESSRRENRLEQSPTSEKRWQSLVKAHFGATINGESHYDSDYPRLRYLVSKRQPQVEGNKYKVHYGLLYKSTLVVKRLRQVFQTVSGPQIYNQSQVGGCGRMTQAGNYMTNGGHHMRQQDRRKRQSNLARHGRVRQHHPRQTGNRDNPKAEDCPVSVVRQSSRLLHDRWYSYEFGVWLLKTLSVG